MRTITEVCDFTVDEVESILMGLAKARIVGRFYCGEFGEQSVQKIGDGYRVTTKHTPEDFDAAIKRHGRAA